MSQDMPWFKCNPSEWLQSCADMESEEFGYYARIILFMYQRGGMAPFDEGKLRHIWNCSRQRARKVRDELIDAGRIERVGEHLTQSRVKRELRIAKKIDQELAEKAGETHQKPDKNPTKTGQFFSDNLLKNNVSEKQIQEPEPEEEKKNMSHRQADGDAGDPWDGDAEFSELWSLWPALGKRRSSRKRAWSAFVKARKRHGYGQVITGARVYLASDDCERSGGQGLHTWLTDERYRVYAENARPRPVNDEPFRGLGIGRDSSIKPCPIAGLG